MTTLQLEILPALQDNYIYLLHDDASGATAAIDPGEAEPVSERLNVHGWKLTHIFCTHHHHDHIGGVMALKRKTSCAVVGFAGDAQRIPIDIRVNDDDSFMFAGRVVETYHVPGHTQGAVMYYLPAEQMAFTGDTLFAMGCGRLLEGEAHQLLASLKRIVTVLPTDTRLYSGHEYAHGNARFALTVDAGNPALLARYQQVADMLDAHTPIQGGTLKEELATNPFLRVGDSAVRASLGMVDASDEAVFAELRSRKDRF